MLSRALPAKRMVLSPAGFSLEPRLTDALRHFIPTGVTNTSALGLMAGKSDTLWRLPEVKPPTVDDEKRAIFFEKMFYRCEVAPPLCEPAAGR